MKSKLTINFSIWVLVSMLMCCAPAFTQTITGDIGGVVTDQSGAIIAGAKVVATNVSTGVATSTTTNNSGIYIIHFLQIGQYKVTFTYKGFATQVSGPFALEVSQVAKLDAKLSVGSQETIQVSSDLSPILNTENGTISTTISQTLIDNLPINGHNFATLSQYTPGVNVADGNQWNGASGSPNNSGERTQSFATLPNVNGNRTYVNNYTLDGVGITDSGANISNGFGAPAYNPSPETVKEVTTITTNPPAEYGDGVAQFITVLRSGTNQYHGTVFFDLQNYLMDANTFGNKRSVPFTPRGTYTQKLYGATLGGPIRIPGLFNGTDRLFFFVDYEGYRKPTSGQGQASVALNAWRGNTAGATSVDPTVSPLAGYAYFGNNGFPQLYDSQNGYAPLNQTINGVTYYNLVPIRNPVAQFLFSHPEFYPLANHAPSTAPIQYNYQNRVKSLQRNDQADIKVDWKISAKDSIFARVSGGEAWDGQSTPITPVSFPTVNDFPFSQYVVNYTRIFTPNIVNEFRGGYTRIAYESFNQDLTHAFTDGNAQVGIPYPQTIPGFTQQAFTQSNNSTGVTSVGTTASGNIAYDNHFYYADNLTWARGRHSLKIGGQLLRIQNNFFLNNTGSGLLGSFGYSGVFTGNPNVGSTLGYDFADFVLNYSNTRSVATQSGDVGQRQSRLAFFAQDSWKPTPKLTVNYGLRWQYDQPVTEVNNKISNISPATAMVVLAGINGNSRALYNSVYNQFAPRLGFSLQVMPRMVVRGGFGLTTFTDYNVQTHTGNAPFHLSVSQIAVSPSTTSAGTPYAVNAGFPTASGTTSTYTAWGNLRPMRSTQYSLVTEYQVSNTAAVTVQYVGEVGQHLSDIRNINQWKLAGTPTSAPFYSAIGSNTLKLLETEATMNFNAGEVTYRQRPLKGLEYTINYTFSKNMTDSGGPIAVNDTNVSSGYPQNNYCLRCEYGPAGGDTRHMFNWTAVYTLPFGHGQQFLANTNRVFDELLGGWTISANAVILSGFPQTIVASSTANVGTAGALRANQYRRMVVKNPVYGYQLLDANGNQTLAGGWGNDPSVLHSGYAANKGTQVGNPTANTCANAGYDDGICAYGQPAAAPAGTAPIFGNAKVGTERATGYQNYDATIQKAFQIWNEHTLLFSCSAYNVGNISSYNNQGHGIAGNGTWGLVQSTRSQQRQLELALKYKF